MDDILKQYHTPGVPFSFSGINNVFRYNKGKIKLNEIEDLLKSSDAYTFHKETKKIIRNPYYVYYKRQQFQIDLINITELQKSNNKVKYLLTCIDVFTKKAFVRPCFNKTASEILNKFKSIIEEAGQPPKTIVSDKGSEIKNRLFNNYCKNKKIKQIYPENEVHASVIERFNKTIQIIIYKYLTQNETNRYIDKLQDFVRGYNNRYHRTIKMTPNEGELRQNHPLIFMEVDKNIRLLQKNRKKNKFDVGDYVRIKPVRRLFKRAYDTQFKEEIFKISSIKDNLAVVMYKIVDLQDEPIVGSFYENEMSLVELPEFFKVKRIIRKRNGGKESLVAFRGYPAKFNEWLPTSYVEKILKKKKRKKGI